MSLSEETRLKLMKVTCQFITDNYHINGGSSETARKVADFYKVLEEVLSLDLTSRKPGKIRQASSFFLRNSKRAFVPFCFLNKGIGTLQELICSTLLALSFQKFGQGNNGSHSFVNRNGHSASPSSNEQHPADSHSAGRTGGVSGHACHQSGCVVHDRPAEQEDQRGCGGFPSPTDAELRQHGCPALVEPQARTFLCQLPDSDLAAINAGVIPTPLMKMMGRVAYDELERRRDA